MHQSTSQNHQVYIIIGPEITYFFCLEVQETREPLFTICNMSNNKFNCEESTCLKMANLIRHLKHHLAEHAHAHNKTPLFFQPRRYQELFQDVSMLR